jgi:hypothetical protein
MAKQPLVGQGFLIIEANDHIGTPHSVVLLWTSDKPDAESSDNTQHSEDRDIQAPVGFEPAIPASKRPQTLASGRAATGIGLFDRFSPTKSPPLISWGRHYCFSVAFVAKVFHGFLQATVESKYIRLNYYPSASCRII